MTQEYNLYYLIFFFQNPSGFSDNIGEAITIGVESECPGVLIILLKFFYHVCCLDDSGETKSKIKEILQGGNDNRNNLIAKVLRNNKLLEVQSLLLCVAIQTHESIEAFENYLNDQFDGEYVKKKTMQKDNKSMNILFFFSEKMETR